MRCVPQVHGVVHDTIQFVKGVITTEMNSALDNPVSGSRWCNTVDNHISTYVYSSLDFVKISKNSNLISNSSNNDKNSRNTHYNFVHVIVLLLSKDVLLQQALA